MKWMVAWWVLEIISHAMWIASMIGLGTFILWVFDLLPCRECRGFKRRLRKAMKNPTPRSEMKPIGEWMDEMIRLNTREKK